MNKLRLIYASSISAVITIIFVVVITAAAEISAPLKGWLKGLSGHHWTSKSILSLALYIIALFLLYAVFKDVEAKKLRNGLLLAIWAALLGTIAIFLFYTGHHLGFY